MNKNKVDWCVLYPVQYFFTPAIYSRRWSKVLIIPLEVALVAHIPRITRSVFVTTIAGLLLSTKVTIARLTEPLCIVLTVYMWTLICSPPFSYWHFFMRYGDLGITLYTEITTITLPNRVQLLFFLWVVTVLLIFGSRFLFIDAEIQSANQFLWTLWLLFSLHIIRHNFFSIHSEVKTVSYDSAGILSNHL